jgi:hypothetical protein
LRQAAGFFCCGFCVLPAAPGAAPPSPRTAGIRMFEPQPRQRTTFPRAADGTASTRWQPRFGHMIRTTSSLPAIAFSSSVAASRPHCGIGTWRAPLER